VTAALPVLLAIGAWVFLVLMVLTLCAAAAGRRPPRADARQLPGRRDHHTGGQRMRGRASSAA